MTNRRVHHKIHRNDDDKVDDVANEVLDQISNSRLKATAGPADAKADVPPSPLDKINVGDLSCRERNAKNVGLDYLVNH